MKKFLVILMCLVLFCGCNNNEDVSYKTISSNEAEEIINSGKDVIILDVREEIEYTSGHILNAINLPLGDIESDFLSKVTDDKEMTILVYCQSGGRSALASDTLAKMGFTDVINIGGISDWQGEIVK